jgi:hypothetical protein
MDSLTWGNKKSRSTGASSSRNTIEEEVMVYHRRSMHEMEEAAGRRRAAHFGEDEAAEALGVLSERVVSNYRYTSAA